MSAAGSEGHAGAAIHRGRVYLIDYDRDKKLDAIRCLSLDDGSKYAPHASESDAPIHTRALALSTP